MEDKSYNKMNNAFLIPHICTLTCAELIKKFIILDIK